MKNSKTWKGTPGPWVAQRNTDFWEVEAMPNIRMNAMLFCYPPGGGFNGDHLGEENKANADAVAAVPDMVELVQMLDLYLMEKVEGLPATVALIDLRNATDAILKKLDL